jgi:hypothetical protein
MSISAGVLLGAYADKFPGLVVMLCCDQCGRYEIYLRAPVLGCGEGQLESQKKA